MRGYLKQPARALSRIINETGYKSKESICGGFPPVRNGLLPSAKSRSVLGQPVTFRTEPPTPSRNARSRNCRA